MEVYKEEYRIRFDDLYKKIDFISLDFVSKLIDEYDGSDSNFVGQDRAIATLDFAVSISNCKYNVYVAGSSGVGKKSTVQNILERIKKDYPLPNDWVYIYNFDNPDEPVFLKLPNSLGKVFKEKFEESIKNLRQTLKKAFEDDSHLQTKEQLIREYSKKKEKIIFEVQQEAISYGFILQVTSGGFLLTPTIGGKPVSNEELQSLDENVRKEIEQKEELLEQKIEDAIRELRKIDKELIENLKNIDKELAQKWISFYIDEFKKEFFNNHSSEKIENIDLNKIDNYLTDVSKDIIDNMDLFLKLKDDTIPNRYKINLIVDNSKLNGIPVVYEEFPTLENLVGKIDKEVIQGVLVTDFTMINAGSFHRANGGFLIINILDLFSEPFAYDALKRTIKNRKIIIEDVHSRIGISTRFLKPEPIPFEGKVILFGPSYIYDLLYNLDEEFFREYFSVIAYFEEEIDLKQIQIFNEKDKQLVLRDYVFAILSIVKKNTDKKFSPEALHYFISRLFSLTGDFNKFPLKMNKVEKLIIEISHLSKGDTILKEDVKNALDFWDYRNSFYRDKIQKYILEDIISVQTEGETIGSVNGLAAISIDQISFGKPVKITATVGLGKEGIISVEKEVGFSGKIHDKAVMIISGYLIEKYSQDFPLSLNIRITFEQNYGILEGDSASCAEVLAIISELSSVPVKHSIAITGSMNQKGAVQPVGAIKEKVEGFFDICKRRGHLGPTTGVIIPHQNIDNLTLKDEVWEYIEKRLFNIFTVKNIDEVIEIATSLPAEKVHNLAYQKLKEYNIKMLKLKELVEKEKKSKNKKVRKK